MTAVESAPKVIGTSVRRKEDASLLRGLGTFVDNLTLPATVNMVVVRSPYPRARITGVNLDAARAAEGVVAAFSGADLAGDWVGGLPCAWPVTEDIKMPPHFPLATDEARYQGDGVAVVVAESRALAKDAAELVEVGYEPLPSNADVAKALGRRYAARPRRPRHERVLRLEARDRRGPGGDRRRRCRRHAPLLPAAAHPERDRAARRARPGRPDRRRDSLVGDAGAAHPPLRAAAGSSESPSRRSA